MATAFINYHGSGAVSGRPSRIGADVPAKALVMSRPGGLWVNTNFKREGKYLHATAYVVCGQPGGQVKTEVFKACVDLDIIEAQLRRFHDHLHAKGDPRAAAVGGIFDSIGKFVNSVGRNKLVKAVSRQVKNVANAGKSVLKNPITGAIVTGAAVVFPPVGAPALAAYAAANAGLAALEKADTVKRTAQDVIKASGVEKLFASEVKKRVGQPLQMANAIKKGLREQRFAPMSMQAMAKQAMALQQQAQNQLNVAKVDARKLLPFVEKAKLKQAALKRIGPAALKQIQERGQRARNSLMQIAMHQQSPNPEVRLQAEKAARIIQVVKAQRQAAQNIARSAQVPLPGRAVPMPRFPGMLPGRFSPPKAGQMPRLPFWR